MCLQWFFFKELKLDHVGKKVLKASEMLAKHGSKIKPTDTYTLAMYSAVRSFQKKNDLPMTGVIDWKTWTKLSAKPTK